MFRDYLIDDKQMRLSLKIESSKLLLVVSLFLGDGGAVRVVSRSFPMKSLDLAKKLVLEADSDFLRRGVAQFTDELIFAKKLNDSFDKALRKLNQKSSKNGTPPKQLWRTEIRR